LDDNNQLLKEYKISLVKTNLNFHTKLSIMVKALIIQKRSKIYYGAKIESEIEKTNHTCQRLIFSIK